MKNRRFAHLRKRALGATFITLAACGSTPVAAPAESQADTNNAATAEAGWTVPRFERVAVGDTGLEAYVIKGFPVFSANFSDDGSLVASAEHVHGGYTHGVVGVRFAEAFTTADDLGELLEGYMDFLKTQVLEAKACIGYGRGHTLESAPSAKGVIDFCTRTDGAELALKGWVTTHHLAVLYVHGPGEYPSFNVRTMFFDGIRFPTP